jgi:hypothetical protein
VFINTVTLDAICPISKQTDFKKCAVHATKAERSTGDETRARSWMLRLVLVTGAWAPANAQPPASSEDAPVPAFEPPDTRPGQCTQWPLHSASARFRNTPS